MEICLDFKTCHRRLRLEAQLARLEEHMARLGAHLTRMEGDQLGARPGASSGEVTSDALEFRPVGKSRTYRDGGVV